MTDYTWIKGLLTLSNAPDITTFNKLGLNVVLPFAGGVAQPLGLGGAKMIPNGSRGAWGEEAKYNVMAYFMEDEPELKNISPDEIIRRIRLCRSQTSLPITCIFTGYFYRETPNNWNTRYAEVIRELDFVCVDVYFYRHGGLNDTCLNNAKKSIEIIQGLGKPVVGVAQGHEEARFKTTRPDIEYVDNFWRSRGCGVIWYAWNVGEGSIGSRGGIDDWYNEQIRIVNEVIEPPPRYPCPHCPEVFTSQNDLDAHIASEHPSPIASWVKPTGHTDPSGKWRNETQLYDNIFTDDTGAYQDKNTISGGNWGDFVYLSTEPIWSNKIRIYPDRAVFKLNSYQIDIDVKKDGSWLDVFSGHLSSNVWNEKTFTPGLVTEARIRVYKYSGVGWTAKIKEFEFESQLRETTTTKTLLHTCNAKISYKLSSFPANNDALSCPHCGLSLGVEGIKGSEDIIDVPEVITPHIVICEGCGSRLELLISSIASKNIQQYCPVCGEPAD